MSVHILLCTTQLTAGEGLTGVFLIRIYQDIALTTGQYHDIALWLGKYVKYSIVVSFDMKCQSGILTETHCKAVNTV